MQTRSRREHKPANTMYIAGLEFLTKEHEMMNILHKQKYKIVWSLAVSDMHDYGTSM